MSTSPIFLTTISATFGKCSILNKVEYLPRFPRKALVQARAPAGIIQDAFDIKLNNTISQDLKKLKFKVSNGRGLILK